MPGFKLKYSFRPNRHHPSGLTRSPSTWRRLIGFATLLCGHFAFAALAATPLVYPAPATIAAVSPAEPLSICVTAIATQSDPARLATLGKREANPRLKRIMYYLAEARATGAAPGDVIDQAQKANGSYGTPRALLVKVGLLRNLKICDGLEMLDPENLAKLKHGNAPVVRRGPYAGEIAEVDHIVPLAEAPELGNEIASLEMGSGYGASERL